MTEADEADEAEAAELLKELIMLDARIAAQDNRAITVLRILKSSISLTCRYNVHRRRRFRRAFGS